MTRTARNWIIATFFFVLFVFSYLNQFLYRYQVPPGGDGVGHNRIVLNILDGNYSQLYTYHSVWHTIVAIVTRITDLRSITVMAWIGPALLVTMGASLYYFNRRTSGTIAGVTSVILIGFLSHQPIQTLYDGGFPNVLAAGTVLPLYYLLINRAYDSKKKWVLIATLAVSTIFLLYTHHLTFLYTFPVLVSVITIQQIRYWRERHITWIAIITLISLALVGLIIFMAWFLNASVGSAKAIATQFLSINTSFPFIHLTGKLDNPNAFLPLSSLPNAIGEAVVVLGAAGFIVAMYYVLFRRTSPQWRLYLILVLWTYVLVVGSQVLAIGFPVRLARDLAIPLALLGGLFVQTMVDFMRHRKMPKIMFILFTITCLSLGAQTAFSRYQKAIQPNTLIDHLEVDTRAANYITENIPVSARIVAFQNEVYLDDFTPIHTVKRLAEPAHVDILSKAPSDAYEPNDYIYLEERFNQPESWNNNHGIIEAYVKSPHFSFIASFEQPEKKVYLFKYNPS